VDRSLRCVVWMRVTIGASIRRRRERLTPVRRAALHLRVSLEFKFAVTTVQEARQIVALPVLWHKRHSRLFIRCLLRNDSGQPTKCQPTEERCWAARKLLLERQQRRGGRASWNIRVRFASRTESLLKRLSALSLTLAFCPRCTFDDTLRLSQLNWHQKRQHYEYYDKMCGNYPFNFINGFLSMKLF